MAAWGIDISNHQKGANLAKAKAIDSKPDWVEVPFPEMIDGVKNGSIQAGYLPEPFATAAKAAGLRDVADLIQADNVGLPGATFITSTATIHKARPTAVPTAMSAARADVSTLSAVYSVLVCTASASDRPKASATVSGIRASPEAAHTTAASEAARRQR